MLGGGGGVVGGVGGVGGRGRGVGGGGGKLGVKILIIGAWLVDGIAIGPGKQV